MNQTIRSSFPIRPCCNHDLALLADIERNAFLALRDAGGVSGEPVASDELLLQRSLADGLLFVATNDEDRPVGFVAATEVDDELYIEELDVLCVVQGRGIGARLMHVIIDRAAKRGLRRWDFPFWSRRTFLQIFAKDCRVRLLTVLIPKDV